MTVDLQRAVARGAELLDQAMPGWPGRVDTGILDMRDMATCVLGQRGGEWAENTICALFGVDPHDWWRPDPLEGPEHRRPGETGLLALKSAKHADPRRPGR